MLPDTAERLLNNQLLFLILGVALLVFAILRGATFLKKVKALMSQKNKSTIFNN
jgi:hypothetical protein